MQAVVHSPALIGRYVIVRLLGRGAMGRVLLAHDPVLDRSVAVKLLRDDLRIEPEQQTALVDRMRQEARARKDFALSDRIRNGLAEIGVTLEDRKEGTTWRAN